jgi:hypothetical protein
MLKRSFALAAFAVLLLGLIGGNRSLSAVGQGQAATVTTNGDPGIAPADPLDLSILSSSDAIGVEASLSAAVAAEPQTASEVAATPAVQPEPQPLVAPSARPVPVAVVAPVAPPAPATCPASYFCYPRVGIAGPIVPYGDCAGSTDVGTAIRSLTCVSPTYLAAHAYTQFGRIAGWRAGDIVFAFGARYVLIDAFTQSGCVTPARALAPLTLQTSLTATTCGPILVVQGRRE